jgi:hypothetical protein
LADGRQTTSCCWRPKSLSREEPWRFVWIVGTTCWTEERLVVRSQNRSMSKSSKRAGALAVRCGRVCCSGGACSTGSSWSGGGQRPIWSSDGDPLPSVGLPSRESENSVLQGCSGYNVRVARFSRSIVPF